MNLDNIKNSKLITDPWEHQVVDNVLDADTLASAQRIAKLLSAIDWDYAETEIVWVSELKELGAEQADIDNIVNAANIVMQNFEMISSPYTHRLKSELGYFNNPRFGISGPGSIGEIHDEGTNKIMAFIVYLEPEESVGTLLYKENDVNTLVNTVEWKQNRAIIMFSQPNVTWHSFSSIDKTRVTLNFYYEKIEALSHVSNNNDLDKITWLHDQFGNDKLIREIK